MWCWLIEYWEYYQNQWTIKYDRKMEVTPVQNIIQKWIFQFKVRDWTFFVVLTANVTEKENLPLKASYIVAVENEQRNCGRETLFEITLNINIVEQSSRKSILKQFPRQLECCNFYHHFTFPKILPWTMRTHSRTRALASNQSMQVTTNRCVYHLFNDLCSPVNELIQFSIDLCNLFDYWNYNRWIYHCE